MSKGGAKMVGDLVGFTTLHTGRAKFLSLSRKSYGASSPTAKAAS